MTKSPRKTSPVSTSQKVENFIRTAIYEGRLKPRERLIEDDIARQLGCSRGPLREAVLRLERDGLIVITPRRGTFIRDISPDEVFRRMKLKCFSACAASSKDYAFAICGSK